MQREPIEDRLVRRLTWQPNGCWTWRGTTHGKGYGMIQSGYVSTNDRRMVSTHRLAYQLFVGPIPEGLQVLHKCDNPPCCNPDHLFIGTNDDNVRDKIQKGRQGISNPPRGEAAWSAKLTNEQVLAIRASTLQGKELARIYGVGPMCISRIRNRQRWVHI